MQTRESLAIAVVSSNTSAGFGAKTIRVVCLARERAHGEDGLASG